MKEVIYWIKFDKDERPIKIRSKTIMEFFDVLRYEMERRGGEPFEWMVRDYK